MMWAVHISDTVLTAPWWLGGLGVAGLLVFLGSRRLRDEEIPQVALLTAAFFVASLIHVRIGPTSVHLLLNGLVGVLLGWRAGLAIVVALLLQAVLFGHGGFTTLGINACIMALPAFGAAIFFRLLRRLPCLQQHWCRGTLVAICGLAWMMSLVYSLTLLLTNHRLALSLEPAGIASVVGGLAPIEGGGPFVALGFLKPQARPVLVTTWANAVTWHPWTLVLAGLFALVMVWVERRLENAPEFPLGLLIGELTVLATIALNCLVLLLGGETNWTYPALLLVIVHLPIAVAEGIVLGFAVAFLARVKPEMLGWQRDTLEGKPYSTQLDFTPSKTV